MHRTPTRCAPPARPESRAQYPRVRRREPLGDRFGHLTAARLVHPQEKDISLQVFSTSHSPSPLFLSIVHLLDRELDIEDFVQKPRLIKRPLDLDGQLRGPGYLELD